MGTTVERDLKTLRSSKLMNFSEFKTMMFVLENYYKEQAQDKRKQENRELDLRPYLYDDGDTYEKPFYNVLLKMLYEVASFKSHDKQHQDLLKIYAWFKSNQKLVSSDTGEDVNQCDSEPPKLYLRPRTTDNCCHDNVKDDSKMKESPRARSVLSYDEHERRQKNKSYNPLDRISVSLKVRPMNVKNIRVKTIETEVHGRRTRRHLSSSIPVYNTRTNPATSLPSSFVLKPAKPTTPPLSTPVSTPSGSAVTSPRFRSPSPRLSPAFRTQSPPQFSLCGRPAIDKRQIERQYEEYMAADDYGFHTYFEQPSPERHKRSGVAFQSNEMNNNYLTIDEEGNMFQRQLRQRLENESMTKTTEIVSNLKQDASLLEMERENLEAHLVREHLQYMKDRFSGEDNGKDKKLTPRTEEDQIREETLLGDQDDPQVKISIPHVKVYDFSEHRPVSAVTFRERGVRVQSVSDMAQPIGHQMEYERNMRNQQNGGSIWDGEYDVGMINHRRTQSAPSSDFTFMHGHHQNRSPSNVARLNQTEPLLNPERKPNDYTVHFPHQCDREIPVKEYKTSGLVTPDTIRYQWTDDGFGNHTYVKRRSPKETQCSKPSRKTSPSAASSDVTMTTGTRGLDKKTLASLMVIKHLGTTNRRDRSYPTSHQLDWKEYGSISSENEDGYSTPKQNIEYLPFWKQVPSNKGLSILNFPELVVCPGPQCDDVSRNGDRLTSNQSDITSSSPQQIMNEMFTSLSPSRRDSGRESDYSTLSINARSISPTSKPGHVNRKLVVTPAPSRPSSARRTPSPSLSNKDPNVNFSAKDFAHSCLHNDQELPDDYAKQREIWAAVNIQRIFRGHIARQYTQSLRQAEKERNRKAAVALQSTFRGYLARKKLIEKNITRYKPNVRDLQWAKDYKEKLKEKENLRNKRNQSVIRKQNRQFGKQQEQMLGITASNRIHDIFNRPKPSKSEMKAAAITIQRYFRGWFVRKSLKRAKEKILKRTFSFNKFIKSYQDLVTRIQKRYNIENPQTALQFHELKEYVERLVQYEIAFGKISANGILNYEDIIKYFAECGHQPSEKEIDDAITMVTKDTATGRNLKKAEAVEVVFQIYIPKGTGLSLADVRKSTWKNPLVNGQDVIKGLSKKELKRTNLDKCFSLVAEAQGERNEIKELLRSPDPRLADVVDRTTENGKPTSRPSTPKMAGGGKLILPRAQYHAPVKPSEIKQKERRLSSVNARK